MFSRLAFENANDSASANELAIGCENGWKPIFGEHGHIWETLFGWKF